MISIYVIFNEGEGDGIEFRLPFKIFSTLPTATNLAFATFDINFPLRIL